MLERFADAVEHQPDSHSRAEHHGDPGQVVELGSRVVGAEPDDAVAAHRDHHAQDEEDVGGDDEQPVEIPDHPAERGFGRGLETGAAQRGPPDHGDDRGDADTDEAQIGRGGFSCTSVAIGPTIDCCQ